MILMAGCASSGPTEATGTHSTTPPSTGTAQLPEAHPQAIEPTAGAQGAPFRTPGADVVGDVNAHAQPLAQVKRELAQLNLCGGAVDSAQAEPVVTSRGPGFIADPGTSQAEGQLPRITAELDALGKALGVTIYGISGYRTPAHSVAVGGYADDPHTKGQAEDIGVNSLLRSSAAQISEAELARFGLYRPFDPSDDPANPEVNHVQLIPAAGPLSLAQSTSTLMPDQLCR
jgi:hypothetical protein